MSLDSTISIVIIIGIIILIAPIIGAYALNRKHMKIRPSCRPFMWGYYNALSTFLLPLLVLGKAVEYNLDKTSTQILLTVLTIIYYSLAILTLRRSRLAFLLLTIISINPILWIINGIYLKNRWIELSKKQNLVDISATDFSTESLKNNAENNIDDFQRSPPKENVISEKSTSKISLSTNVSNDHFAQAYSELEDGKQDKGLWARCYAKTNGNEAQAKAAYLNYRAEALAGDLKFQSKISEVEAIARDSRIRLLQKMLFEKIEKIQQEHDTRIEYDKYYQALVKSRYLSHAKNLIWLCEYELLIPGDDKEFPNKYIVRKAPGEEPVGNFNTENELIRWTINSFSLRRSSPIEYI